MNAEIHSRLEQDSQPVLRTEHCHIRLLNDSRWPWLIVVPANPRIEELHQFDDAERQTFMTTVSLVSELLQQIIGCQSINVAMLGNVVSQLHCHVIARDENDSNWPGPVWGFGEAEAYEQLPDWLTRFKSELAARL